jgi:translation initiation factor IF-2
LCASLVKIQNEEVKVTVVHSGVGAINESDVMLASAANALIIGFNVRPDANARKIAESEKVDIRPYRVIYDAINDVEAAIKGMLAPKFEEDVIGRVEVRQVITISKMIIAGCYVTEGKVTNNAKIRVVRDGIVIAEDEMESLRRFKDDVKEVAAGYECGITLAKFHDIKENDQFEVYVMKEVSPRIRDQEQVNYGQITSRKSSGSHPARNFQYAFAGHQGSAYQTGNSYGCGPDRRHEPG